MLADVTIDGRTEAQFRLAIESMLRDGGADEAAHILKSELAWLAGDDHPLPGRFRLISAEELEVTGWDSLIERIGELDSPGDPITAIGIDVCGMQAGLGARPVLAFETTYYTDQAWGFSHADREGICAGYHGTTNAWQGAFEDIDDTLSVTGLDDLNAVIAALENHCRSGEATMDERRAYVVGACYLAVLIHQAVRDKALAEGLPRAMAVLVGSNEAYPWFEAPAVTAREGGPIRHAPQRSTIEQAMNRAATPPIAFAQEPTPQRRPLDLGAHLSEMPRSELARSELARSELVRSEMPRPLFDSERPPFAPPTSLNPAPLNPGLNPALNPESPFASPAFAEYSDSEDAEDVETAPTPLQFPDAPYEDAVVTGGWEVEDEPLDEAETAYQAPTVDLNAQDNAQDYAILETDSLPAQPAPVEDEEALHLPPPGIHVTGTQLRRRYVDRETIAIEEERRPGLLERLFGRR